ncbi:MAG: hypothetical protein QM692_04565 [Thermomicrobiales bacterium]
METSKGAYHAVGVIITTGPWAAELLGELGLPLEALRRINASFRPERPDWWTEEAGAPNFLLDVPEGGFSGRGFKSSPVVGEILAELATAGETRHEIGFLNARRFATSAA